MWILNMHSIARLITLPFLLGTLIASANAEIVSPEQATELLAKSQTIDRKCNFLTAAEHSTLSNLVARAEIALAQQQSVADASAALARGKAAGKTAYCSEEERTEVTSTLSAAQIASAQAAAPAPIIVTAEPALQTMEKRARKKIEDGVAVKKSKQKTPTTLLSYANLTQHYYLQRRCGTMGSHAINALYKNVVATHQRTVQTFGKVSTAAAMHRAKTLAATKTCS